MERWRRRSGTRWARLSWRTLAVAGVLAGCGALEEESGDEPAAADERRGAQRQEGRTYIISVSSATTVDAREPDHNFGSTARLTVDGNPDRRAYVRFAVGDIRGRITRATLKLYTTDPSVDGPEVYATSNDWHFSRITWNNAPAPYAPAIADLGGVADDSFVELDVTSHVRSTGTFSFVLVSTVDDGVVFLSDNGVNDAQGPQLLIETEP